MTTYVLGAGASCHAGYPLANSMGAQLFLWMHKQGDAQGFAARYPATAQFFENHFGVVENIEELMTRVQQLIDGYEEETPEQRAIRSVVANERAVLVQAVRCWFAEIRQQGRAVAYRDFARNVVHPDDCIVTFNYDVSLDRELALARRFAVGDGYGFPIETLPCESPVKILKLHGSMNWLALMFGGLKSGFAQFEPGNTLGSRPVIGRDELALLGCDAADPAFQRGGGALPVMIMPTRSKEFFFAANTGVEYSEFWDDLWRQAARALEVSNRVQICGYGMLPVDERARELLLKAPKKDAEIVVGSGGDTERIVREYREAGYPRASAATEVIFENWVGSCANTVVA